MSQSKKTKKPDKAAKKIVKEDTDLDTDFLSQSDNDKSIFFEEKKPDFPSLRSQVAELFDVSDPDALYEDIIDNAERFGKFDQKRVLGVIKILGKRIEDLEERM